jgi:ATP-binding protein involved in chromosome partitioning
MTLDPRPAVIEKRLAGVKRIIAVTGGKGGIGKSVTATTLALTLAKKGYRAGLLDVDVSAPSDHVILGAEVHRFPDEDKGIVPPKIHGIKFMSFVYFTDNRAAPLRGNDVSNALLESLAVTQWRELDFFIVDMPPGIGDAAMDVIQWLPRAEFLILTTPSKVAFEIVKKLVSILKELKKPILGAVENMKTDGKKTIRDGFEALHISYLGEIPWDASLEDAIGDADALLETEFAKKIDALAEKIVSD